MLNISDIKTVHIEASTYCNARCPECPRNYRGWNILNLPQKHLTPNKLITISKQLPETVHALFNGNYGDPMMNPTIIELVQLFKTVTVTTNGSCGKIETYTELAKLGAQVVFSIDGLEDTNHIYRQDVTWSKVMERAKTFIDHGGIAQWKFVIFKHNAHQIESAERLGREMGFSKFMAVNDQRNYGPILDNDGNEVGWLFPHDRTAEPYDYNIDHDLSLIKNPYDLQNDYSGVIIDCELKRQRNIYVTVDGEVLPCCYHGVDQHIHPKGNTLQEQLDSFQWLENTWGKKECNETCYNSCKRRM